MGFHAEENQDVGSNVAPSSQPLAKSPEPKIPCSLCGKSFTRDKTPSFPFCSERCRQIDLGHWLQESYGLPVEGADAFEEDV